jgi:predicted nucleic acid-binding protein
LFSKGATIVTEKKVCIDANFIVRYLGSNDSESIYRQKWQQWQVENYILVAPTLFMYEICNAFHRATIARQITPEEAEQLIEQALNLGIQFYGDAELHRKAFDIAQRYNLSATYDAHYLALADRLNIEFWTSKLHRHEWRSFL